MGVTFSNTATQAYDLLGTLTPTTGQNSMSFSSIPQTHKHLIIHGSTRRNAPGAGARGLYITLNGASSGYNHGTIDMSGSTVSCYAGINSSELNGVLTFDGTGKGSCWTLTINDYTNTNFFRNVHVFGLHGQEGSPHIRLSGNLLQSASALTSMTISEPFEGFVSGDNVRIYGVKEA